MLVLIVGFRVQGLLKNSKFYIIRRFGSDRSLHQWIILNLKNTEKKVSSIGFLVFKQRQNLSTRIICQLFSKVLPIQFIPKYCLYFFKLRFISKKFQSIISCTNFNIKFYTQTFNPKLLASSSFLSIYSEAMSFWICIILKKYLLTLTYLSKNC